MRYRHFDPDAIEADDDGPSQRDLLTQIEADHYAAKERDDKDAMKLLDERYKLVSEADDDADARQIYNNHLVQPPVVPDPNEE